MRLRNFFDTSKKLEQAKGFNRVKQIGMEVKITNRPDTFEELN
jgi:hypothetical protein